VIVGGGHGLAVAQVDLLLPGAPLALLDSTGTPAPSMPLRMSRVDELLLGGLQDVVVLGVPADRLEAGW